MCLDGKGCENQRFSLNRGLKLSLYQNRLKLEILDLRKCPDMRFCIHVSDHLNTGLCLFSDDEPVIKSFAALKRKEHSRSHQNSHIVFWGCMSLYVQVMEHRAKLGCLHMVSHSVRSGQRVEMVIKRALFGSRGPSWYIWWVFRLHWSRRFLHIAMQNEVLGKTMALLAEAHLPPNANNLWV